MDEHTHRASAEAENEQIIAGCVVLQNDAIQIADVVLDSVTEAATGVFRVGMINEMGIFRTTVGVAPWSDPDNRADVADVMVDTGSEYNWMPEELLARLGVAPVRIDRFETADGRILERRVGFAMIYAGGRSAPSIVVFAGPGDMALLGAHGLEGLNLRVDSPGKNWFPPDQFRWQQPPSRRRS